MGSSPQAGGLILFCSTFIVWWQNKRVIQTLLQKKKRVRPTSMFPDLCVYMCVPIILSLIDYFLSVFLASSTCLCLCSRSCLSLLSLSRWPCYARVFGCTILSTWRKAESWGLINKRVQISSVLISFSFFFVTFRFAQDCHISQRIQSSRMVKAAFIVTSLKVINGQTAHIAQRDKSDPRTSKVHMLGYISLALTSFCEYADVLEHHPPHR